MATSKAKRSAAAKKAARTRKRNAATKAAAGWEFIILKFCLDYRDC
ncbi:MAG: hypothetical protein JRZ95_01395, partial [Nitrososphaerota archaeon]|nr:hypothetical protein [Nitrososphaerota archaeon]